jgi:hypothetical protein
MFYNLQALPIPLIVPDNILNSILPSSPYLQTLTSLQAALSTFDVLNFYTDGSLSNPGTDSYKMGIGWICIDTDSTYHKFEAAIEN